MSRARDLSEYAQKQVKSIWIHFETENRRCFFDVCLQLALTQSLRCPVMEHSAIARTIRMSKWTPVWTTGSGGLF